MSHQHVFDLGRIHIESANDHHVFQPTNDAHITTFVHRGQVTGMQKAVGVNRRCSASWVVEIVLHHAVTAHQQLARFTTRNLGAVRVGDDNFQIVHCPTSRGRDGFSIVFRSRASARSGFGQPIPGENRGKGQLGAHLFNQSNWDIGGTSDRDAQRAEVVVRPVGVIENRSVDRRRTGQHGDLFGLYQRQHRGHIEHRNRENCRPTQQARHPASLVAKHMKERVDNEVTITN